MNINIIKTALMGIIILTVLFQFYADAVPLAQQAGDEINNTGVDGVGVNESTLPLSSFFSGQGIVFLLIMAALLILVIRSFMDKK